MYNTKPFADRCGEIVLKFKRCTQDAFAPLLLVDNMGFITAILLRACKDIVVPGRSTAVVYIGISFASPPGTYLRLTNSKNLPIQVRVGAGIIDEDYRGEVSVVLHNASDAPFSVGRGDTVALGTVIGNPRYNVRLTPISAKDEDTKPESYNAERATPYSAGVDIRAAEDVILKPLALTLVDFGVSAEIIGRQPDDRSPKDAKRIPVDRSTHCDKWDSKHKTIMRYASRSGIAMRQGVYILDQVVYSPVRKVQMSMMNYSDNVLMLKKGDRIAQIVLESEPVILDKLHEIRSAVEEGHSSDSDMGITERGDRGFGSTGTS